MEINLAPAWTCLLASIETSQNMFAQYILHNIFSENFYSGTLTVPKERSHRTKEDFKTIKIERLLRIMYNHRVTVTLTNDSTTFVNNFTILIKIHSIYVFLYLTKLVLLITNLNISNITLGNLNIFVLKSLIYSSIFNCDIASRCASCAVKLSRNWKSSAHESFAGAFNSLLELQKNTVE